MGNKRDIVVRLINEGAARSMAEVGVWKGQLSQMVLERCPTVNALHLIDPWSAQLNDFDADEMPSGRYQCTMSGELLPQRKVDKLHARVVGLAGKHRGRATVHRVTSAEAASAFADGELDFVFLDAIHLYANVKEDIALWLPKLRPGGVLCGDDYTPAKFPGLCRAVDEVLPHRELERCIWWVTKPERTLVDDAL